MTVSALNESSGIEIFCMKRNSGRWQGLAEVLSPGDLTKSPKKTVKFDYEVVCLLQHS